MAIQAFLKLLIVVLEILLKVLEALAQAEQLFS